jgi:tol-pal system protein YbgF
MTSPSRHPLSIGVLLAVASFGSGAADPLAPAAVGGAGTVEDRVARIERVLENQGGSDVMLRMQQLQQEMQELRGLVETQQFELQKLQRQQRDQFLDLDSRLGAEPGAGELGAPLAATGPTSGATPGAAPGATGAIDVSGADLKPPLGAAEPPPVTAPVPFSPAAVGIPALPTPETTGGNERDAYRDAFELLKERKYPEAVEAFNDLLRRYPQGEFTDNARYWLGETYYVQRNYPAALAEFDRLVQLNPTSNKIPGAMLKIGYIQYEQEAFDQARAALTQVVTQYPDSTEARLARSRLDRMGRERR